MQRKILTVSLMEILEEFFEKGDNSGGHKSYCDMNIHNSKVICLVLCHSMQYC